MAYRDRATIELLEELEAITDLARTRGDPTIARRLDLFIVKFRKVDDSIEHAVTVLRSTLSSKTARQQIADYDEREAWVRRIAGA